MTQLSFLDGAPAPSPTATSSRPTHISREEATRRFLAGDAGTEEHEWLLAQLATKDVPPPPKPIGTGG